MLKIRRPLGRLIFNMGIAIPGKTVFLIETAPWYPLIDTCGHGFTLRWRHNGQDSVSNHQPHDCSLNRLFRRRSRKTSKLRVNGLCAGNSPGTDEFPAQMASYAENVSIWWRHHDISIFQRENYYLVIVSPLMFVLKRPSENKSVLVRAMAWAEQGADKATSHYPIGPVMTHITDGYMCMC